MLFLYCYPGHFGMEGRTRVRVGNSRYVSRGIHGARGILAACAAACSQYDKEVRVRAPDGGGPR